MKRASYREGVAWLALNNDPDVNDPAEVQGLIPVLLLADLFAVEPERVAADIIKFRAKHE